MGEDGFRAANEAEKERESAMNSPADAMLAVGAAIDQLHVVDGEVAGGAEDGGIRRAR